jgi:hypothetical protein
MLEVQCDRAWYDIVTLDESWFWLKTDYEFVWLPQDEKVPEREQHTIQLYSIKKIYAHDRLESAQVPFDQGSRKDRKFNAGYYITEILEPLSHCLTVPTAVNRSSGQRAKIDGACG